MDTIVRKNTKKSFDFINEQVNKKSINKLLAQVYLEFGGAKTATLADNLTNLGYRYATKSGTTISIADLSVPADKKELLNDGSQEQRATYSFYVSDAAEKFMQFANSILPYDVETTKQINIEEY